MRTAFDLDLATLDTCLMLIHGAYACGKTHLQWDFLKWAQGRGEVAFLNVKGEDGYASIAAAGLGKVGETVDSVDAYYEALADYRSRKLVALAIDSLPAFYGLNLIKHVGAQRYPDPKQDGERAKMLWGQISMGMKDAIQASRVAAPFVLWVAAYDRSDDPVSGGKGITPDLPGKLAYGCAGWFDFVGYLTAQTLGPGRVQRKVSFAPTSAVLTRQRIAKAITDDITIPDDRGGWDAIYRALQAGMPQPKDKE